MPNSSSEPRETGSRTAFGFGSGLTLSQSRLGQTLHYAQNAVSPVCLYADADGIVVSDTAIHG